MKISNSNEIEAKLKNIPFLKLDVDFDFDGIKEEILSNSVWYDYIPPYFKLTPEVKERHKNYKHFTISTVDPSKKSSIVREHFAWWTNPEKTEVQHYYDVPINNRNWYWTDIADKFPKLKDLILTITDKPILCKIVKSGTEHSLGWHSHQNDSLIKWYNKPEQCIMHIPIITNSNVAHIVSKDMPADDKRLTFLTQDEYKNSDKFYIENFTEGSVWFFNGYWPHAYKNYSTRMDRYTILFYSDLDDNPTIRNLMVRNIEKYNGPIITN